jgi:monofunctional biosynthetic peptidoglycan transglycosylase
MGIGATVQALTWPSVAPLARTDPTTTAFITRYREGRRAAGQSDYVAWHWVPRARISPHLQRAVIAAEDIGFFSHGGFDLGEMRLALREAIADGEALRGASTLSQQVTKNLWLSPSRNPFRKVKEAILTWQLERSLSKYRILELYLNVAEFGPGTYGAEAAAQRYFGKSALDLTEHESAQLAAGLSRPSRWNPGTQTTAYATQVSRIELRMARAAFLWKRLGFTPPVADSGDTADTVDAPSDPMSPTPGDEPGSAGLPLDSPSPDPAAGADSLAPIPGSPSPDSNAANGLGLPGLP